MYSVLLNSKSIQKGNTLKLCIIYFEKEFHLHSNEKNVTSVALKGIVFDLHENYFKKFWKTVIWNVVREIY